MGGKYKKQWACDAFFSYNSGAKCLVECYDRRFRRKRKQPSSRTGIFRHGRRTQTIQTLDRYINYLLVFDAVGENLVSQTITEETGGIFILSRRSEMNPKTERPDCVRLAAGFNHARWWNRR